MGVLKTVLLASAALLFVAALVIRIVQRTVNLEADTLYALDMTQVATSGVGSLLLTGAVFMCC
jgi:hypothetical protein